MLSIVSYNLNGIRAAVKNGLLTWLEQTKPDIFCVQETKATPDQLDVAPDGGNCGDHRCRGADKYKIASHSQMLGRIVGVVKAPSINPA